MSEVSQPRKLQPVPEVALSAVVEAADVVVASVVAVEVYRWWSSVAWRLGVMA